MSVLLLHPSSHSFFSCVPGDRTSKDRGMFDSLLDSRCPENTRLGDTPTLSLICHPMQVILCSPPWVALLYVSILFTYAFNLCQALRLGGSHSRQPKRTLFICRHGERMDVVFGKHWLSLCSDSKGEEVTFLTDMSHMCLISK